MSIRTSFGLSRSKNIPQPQQQTNPSYESRINQVNPGHSNGQYRVPSTMTGQTNGSTHNNIYNNNPPTATNYLPTMQQDIRHDYKPQGKVG